MWNVRAIFGELSLIKPEFPGQSELDLQKSLRSMRWNTRISIGVLVESIRRETKERCKSHPWLIYGLGLEQGHHFESSFTFSFSMTKLIRAVRKTANKVCPLVSSDRKSVRRSSNWRDKSSKDNESDHLGKWSDIDRNLFISSIMAIANFIGARFHLFALQVFILDWKHRRENQRYWTTQSLSNDKDLGTYVHTMKTTTKLKRQYSNLSHIRIITIHVTLNMRQSTSNAWVQPWTVNDRPGWLTT